MQTPILNSANIRQPDDDEIDLQRYREFLRAYWKIIIGGAVGAALVAVGLVLLRPPIFQATATLMPVPGNAIPAGLTPETAKTFLVSPEIVSETVNELGLGRNGVTTSRFIADSVDVQLAPGTNVITLSVALSDPTKARLAAELLSTKAIGARQRADQQTASSARTALEKSVAEADRNLKEAEDRLSTFQATAGLSLLEAEARSADERRSRLSALGIRLETERARLATLEEELARQPGELTMSPQLGGTAKDRVGSSTEQSQTASRPLNSVRAMLEYDVAQSRATIAGLIREQRQTLAMTSAREGNKLGDLYRHRLALARLQSEYDARSREYIGVLQRYQEASLVSTAAQLQILSRPAQPEEPMPRQRRRFVALGGLVGLLCGVAAAWVLDIRRRDDLRQVTTQQRGSPGIS